jgi:hypothetical protein
MQNLALLADGESACPNSSIQRGFGVEKCTNSQGFQQLRLKFDCASVADRVCSGATDIVEIFLFFLHPLSAPSSPHCLSPFLCLALFIFHTFIFYLVSICCSPLLCMCVVYVSVSVSMCELSPPFVKYLELVTRLPMHGE